MFFFRKIFNNKKFKNNNVILGEFPKVENSKIQFLGSNNILFCEKGVTLKNSHIAFHGNNSLIFLRKGVYALEITIFNNFVF